MKDALINYDNSRLARVFKTPPKAVAPAAASSSSEVEVSAGYIASGSGDTYQVTLLTGETVTAKQLQIADGETIPANTGVLLAKVDNQWVMQVAVWL